ncbi:MAG: hypothetical protein IKC80_07500, partial [Kiritimatiellae bacterium]|nr:hypothetical protein [Kiritimatiellia bacterium]
MQVAVSLPGAIQTSPFAVTDKEPPQAVRGGQEHHRLFRWNRFFAYFTSKNSYHPIKHGPSLFLGVKNWGYS